MNPNELAEQAESNLLAGGTLILLEHVRRSVQQLDFDYLEKLRANMGFYDSQMSRLYDIFLEGSAQLAKNLFSVMLHNMAYLVPDPQVTLTYFDQFALKAKLGGTWQWTLMLNFIGRDFRLMFKPTLESEWRLLIFNEWHPALYFFTQLLLEEAGVGPQQPIDVRLFSAFNKWITGDESVPFWGQLLPAKLYQPPFVLPARFH